MYCLVFCFKFYFGFFWWSSSLQQVFGHVSLSTLCAFFKSRKDKGPWQVAGLTRHYNQAAIWFYLIKWSLYYHFTDLSQTLNWKLWDLIPCVFICSLHIFPSSRSSLPSAQALPVSQVWEHLNFPSHISLCASTKVYNIWFRELVPTSYGFTGKLLPENPFVLVTSFFVRRIFIIFFIA